MTCQLPNKPKVSPSRLSLLRQKKVTIWLKVNPLKSRFLDPQGWWQQCLRTLWLRTMARARIRHPSLCVLLQEESKGMMLLVKARDHPRPQGQRALINLMAGLGKWSPISRPNRQLATLLGLEQPGNPTSATRRAPLRTVKPQRRMNLPEGRPTSCRTSWKKLRKPKAAVVGSASLPDYHPSQWRDRSPLSLKV